MGNIIKTGVNILESGADLIKGRKSSSALKPFSIDDIPFASIDDLTPITKADDTKPTRKSIGELTAINQGSPAFQNTICLH